MRSSFIHSFPQRDPKSIQHQTLISDWGIRGQFLGLNDMKLKEEIPERMLVTEERRLTIYVKFVCKLFSTSWLTLDWIYTEESSNNQTDQWQPKLESENGAQTNYFVAHWREMIKFQVRVLLSKKILDKSQPFH